MAGEKPSRKKVASKRFGPPLHTPGPSRLEQLQNKPLTHEDLVAHIDGSATRADLANESLYPGVKKMIEHYQELLNSGGSTDSGAPVSGLNKVRFGGLLAQINHLLGKGAKK